MPHGFDRGSPRALIVDDEIIFAINLEADMHASYGFDICDLAGDLDSKLLPCLQ